MQDRQILIVLTPMRFPQAANLVDAEESGAGRDFPSMSCVFDAGFDFYCRFLMNPATLNIALERIQHPRRRHDQAIDEEGLLLRRKVLSEPERWGAYIKRAAHVMTRLRSGWTGDLSRTASDRQVLDDCLELMSAAFFPAIFSRYGFHHSGLDGIAAVKGFIEKDGDNPFMLYGQTADPFADCSSAPEVVAVTVGSAGQVGPAASLIACWRARWPWITWLAVGERPWTDHVNAVLNLHIPEDLSPWFDGTCSPSNAGATKRLERPLHADVLQTILNDASAENIRFLVWHDRRGDLKPITGGLYTAASQGIWNHLILPEPQKSGQNEELSRFAEKNPTIVHSWCLRRHPSLFSDPLDIYPSESPPYKDTKPLPGVPLWQILRCPMDLCAALQHVKNKTLQRMRFDRAEGTIWEIGQNLIYHYLEPSALPEACLDEICRMVEAGGSVGVTWLRHNLESAFLIAYVEEKRMIVGCSSLKYPRKEYIQAVSAQSGIDLNGFLERGYTSVRPEYRGMGIGAKLLEELTIRAQSYKIFSIIAEDNRATQKMAMRTGTCRVAIFYSERAGKHVGVWIPEWMLPKNLHLPPQPDFDHQPDGLRP